MVVHQFIVASNALRYQVSVINSDQIQYQTYKREDFQYFTNLQIWIRYLVNEICDKT